MQNEIDVKLLKLIYNEDSADDARECPYEMVAYLTVKRNIRQTD